MSHGSPLSAPPPAPELPALLKPLQVLVTWINRLVFIASTVALLLAAVVLTHSVVVRNLWGASTEWQEELTVFLLLGAMFLSMGGVQEKRGHIGIDALVGILPPGLNRARQLLVDLVSLAFTGFFAWKCWQLLFDALADDKHTNTAWAPPIWIPYGLMVAGMTLLAVQVALQFLAGLLGSVPGDRERGA